MTKRILEILDNVRYWDTCPDDYKKEIETFLENQKQTLNQHDGNGQRELLTAFLQFYRGDNLNREDETTIQMFLERKSNLYQKQNESNLH